MYATNCIVNATIQSRWFQFFPIWYTPLMKWPVWARVTTLRKRHQRSFCPFIHLSVGSMSASVDWGLVSWSAGSLGIQGTWVTVGEAISLFAPSNLFNPPHPHPLYFTRWPIFMTHGEGVMFLSLFLSLYLFFCLSLIFKSKMHLLAQLSEYEAQPKQHSTLSFLENCVCNCLRNTEIYCQIVSEKLLIV